MTCMTLQWEGECQYSKKFVGSKSCISSTDFGTQQAHASPRPPNVFFTTVFVIYMTQNRTVRVCDAWHLGHFGRHTLLHYICGDKHMHHSDIKINTVIAICMTQHSVRVCVMLALHLGQFLLQEICRHFLGSGQSNKIPQSHFNLPLISFQSELS